MPGTIDRTSNLRLRLPDWSLTRLLPPRRDQAREGTRKPGDGLEDAAIRRQLYRIFGSPEFSSSKRCQEFLRFVVDKTLAGHADDLKERTIGIELLGRPTSYEPSTGASVR